MDGAHHFVGEAGSRGIPCILEIYAQARQTVTAVHAKIQFPKRRIAEAGRSTIDAGRQINTIARVNARSY
jgi:hypothetical protein